MQFWAMQAFLEAKTWLIHTQFSSSDGLIVPDLDIYPSLRGGAGQDMLFCGAGRGGAALFPRGGAGGGGAHIPAKNLHQPN